MKEILPVACPACGQYQNETPGGFDPDNEPFGPVNCMVCGHAFTKEEYMRALELRIKEFEALRGPRRR